MTDSIPQQAGPVAWMTEDGQRVVTAATKAANDIGAGASAMRAYSVPLYLAAPLAVEDSRERCASEDAPNVWVIFDSQGFYGAVENETEAAQFCAHYNTRAEDPLKPYSYRRYIAAMAAASSGKEKME